MSAVVIEGNEMTIGVDYCHKKGGVAKEFTIPPIVLLTLLKDRP